jgi:hypothetical protein
MLRTARFVLGAYYAIVLGLPAMLFAQASGIPSRIVPCDGVGVGGGAECTACHLGTLAQNILNTGVFLFVFLAAIMFAYAGFMYLSDSAIGKQQQAKAIFGHVTGGLVILLAAWLIVDTLMKAVLGGSFGPWNNICTALGM